MTDRTPTGDTPTHGVHVIPGEVPEGLVPPSTSTRPPATRIVVWESDICAGVITDRSCDDCEDDACEHECHDTEPTGDRTPTGDLRERLREALIATALRQAREKGIKLSTFTTATIHANAESLADAVLPVVEAETANLREDLQARIKDHAMAAKFVGEWIGLSSPLPAGTSIGCVQGLAFYADDDIAALRKRAENADRACAAAVRQAEAHADISRQRSIERDQAEDRLRKATDAYTRLHAEVTGDRWQKRAEEAERQRDEALEALAYGAETLRRAEKAERRLAELESAVTWQTSCTSCSRVLDGSYAETQRAEKAEAAVQRVREAERIHRVAHPSPVGGCPACHILAALKPQETRHPGMAVHGTAYETDTGRYVIADRGGWLPGTYATEDAARLAVSLDDEQLVALRDTINIRADRAITVADLRAVLDRQSDTERAHDLSHVPPKGAADA